MSAGGYYQQGGAPPHFGNHQQFPQGGPGWGAPPQQQLGQHPNQFQQPPPQQWGPPQGQQFSPQGPYGQPPVQQQGYNPGFQQGPPQQSGFQQGPPPQQNLYQGQPPQQAPPQHYNQGALPSPGYNPNDIAQGNASNDVEALIKAMSGIRRDHATIIRILTRPGPREMPLLRESFLQRTKQPLESKIESSFRGHYGDVLLQLVRGPLLSDAWNVNRAIKGVGTKEDMLNDVLIGRSNADMRAIKQAYHQIFKKTMESDVEGDLSLKTKTMFQLIMRASRTEESHPYNPHEIAQDVAALHSAMGSGHATNQEAVFTILTQRSENQIRAIAQDFHHKYHKSLEDTLRSNFSGHMQDALLLALGRATDRAKTDAYSLEATMKGLGTYDDLLVNETVRIHWDRQNMDQVKKAYQHFFKRDLITRVRGETSGDYRDALVACLS